MDYVAATTLLSMERLTYGYLWAQPKEFAKMAKVAGFQNKEPEFVYLLVRLYKLVQVSVFSMWYHTMFGLNFPEISGLQLGLCLILGGFGQFLNAMVWYRIGIDGVCYGCKFGRHIPWCTEFPFNVFHHPQYLGCILSVWGMFILVWDAPDWYMMPLIETVLYTCSMFLWET